jgi:hypothetical protein
MASLHPPLADPADPRAQGRASGSRHHVARKNAAREHDAAGTNDPDSDKCRQQRREQLQSLNAERLATVSIIGC